ncbi:MAG: hypothetical protein KGN00_00275 [Chloroflexota bacterium]|nr:hypothetical protein [Chloroflexota bacterium]
MPEMRAQTEREAELEGITEQETATLPFELTAVSEPFAPVRATPSIVTEPRGSHPATIRAERLLRGPRLGGQAGTLPTERSRHHAGPT